MKDWPASQHASKLASEPVADDQTDEARFRSRKDFIKLTLRLPPEVVQDVKFFCVENRFNLQDVIAEAIVRYLDERKQKDWPACQHASKLATCSVCSSSVCVCPEKPEENTHTPGQHASMPSSPRGQPNLPTIGGDLIRMPAHRAPISQYDLRTRRRYANAHTSLNAKGEQIPLGYGWIVRGQDGRYDELIEEWLEEQSKPNPNNCPDCEGSNFVRKTYMETGDLVKCTHPKLQPGRELDTPPQG